MSHCLFFEIFREILFTLAKDRVLVRLEILGGGGKERERGDFKPFKKK